MGSTSDEKNLRVENIRIECDFLFLPVIYCISFMMMMIIAEYK